MIRKWYNTGQWPWLSQCCQCHSAGVPATNVIQWWVTSPGISASLPGQWGHDGLKFMRDHPSNPERRCGRLLPLPCFSAAPALQGCSGSVIIIIISQLSGLGSVQVNTLTPVAGPMQSQAVTDWTLSLRLTSRVRRYYVRSIRPVMVAWNIGLGIIQKNTGSPTKVSAPVCWQQQLRCLGVLCQSLWQET